MKEALLLELKELEWSYNWHLDKLAYTKAKIEIVKEMIEKKESEDSSLTHNQEHTAQN